MKGCGLANTKGAIYRHKTMTPTRPLWWDVSMFSHCVKTPWEYNHSGHVSWLNSKIWPKNWGKTVRMKSGWLRVARGGSGAKAPPLAARPLFLRSYQRYTTAQNHPTDHLRLTLDKLTGWLASLDGHKPHTNRILSHRIASRDPLPLYSRKAAGLIWIRFVFFVVAW